MVKRMNMEEYMTPSEVAALFRVDPKTVSRWATSGKLPSYRTLGGHRRYKGDDVRALQAATLEYGRGAQEDRA